MTDQHRADFAPRGMGVGKPQRYTEWPPAVRDLFDHPSIETVERLHRLCSKRNGMDPSTILAAADALIELAQPEPHGHLARVVRRMIRNGQEIFEVALDRLEGSSTPGIRHEAQQLLDRAMEKVVPGSDPGCRGGGC